jgi:hypothetical protein
MLWNSNLFLLKHQSLMLKFSGTLTAVMLVASISYGQSIHELTDTPTGAQNVSVVVNPRNPSNLILAVAGSVYYSVDAGKTWEKSLSAPETVSPVVIANTKGEAHYLTVEQTADGKSAIFCRASGDGGKTWIGPAAITASATADQRMPWGIYDGKENLYVTWTQFDQYNNKDQNCQSRIMLARSPNGRKWNDPVEISQTPGDCQDGKMATGGSIPIVGIDGKIFATWTHGEMIMLDRSFDGNLWLSNDIAFLQQKGGRTLDIPQVGVTNSKAIIVSDRSKNDHRGLLYLAFADQRTSKSRTDIYFSRSMNYGDLWISPEKIASSSDQHHQFLPWLTIDQSTGHIYVVYYQMSEDGMIDVNLSWSIDAGLTFKTNKLTKTSFKLTFQGKPEYINVSAYKGTICAAWIQSNNDSKNTVHIATLTHDDLLKNP